LGLFPRRKAKACRRASSQVEKGGCRRAEARLIELTDLLLSRRAVYPVAALHSGNNRADGKVMILGLKRHFALLIGLRPERPLIDLKKRFCHWFGLCWCLRQNDYRTCG